jgi:hypothetical protein
MLYADHVVSYVAEADHNLFGSVERSAERRDRAPRGTGLSLGDKVDLVVYGEVVFERQGDLLLLDAESVFGLIRCWVGYVTRDVNGDV